MGRLPTVAKVCYRLLSSQCRRRCASTVPRIFGVDPAYPDNQGIADITLAPRDPIGLVRFAADVTILTPREPERSNRRLLLDVPNRGNRLAMRFLNWAPGTVPGTPIDPGDGFVMRQGYTVAWCGWQHDVPNVPGLMRASVPEA